MNELVIISGKGGTGKTSITSALATLAQPVVLVDCDVDAPDLYLIAQPQIQQHQLFSGGKKARIEPEKCDGCGRCAMTCRFHAISKVTGSDEIKSTYIVDSISCEGCGACVTECPTKAIRFEPATNGKWFISKSRFGPMVHAQLDPGEENSGKLVSMVRREARHLAQQEDLPLVLVDGSPGVGCPVIASLTNAHMALVVAEPTPSGVHDALRVMDLARQLNVPTVLCVNRWTLNPTLTTQLEIEAATLGVQSVGRVREDLTMVQAQMQGLSVIERNDSTAAADVRSLWLKLQEIGLPCNRNQPPSVQGKEHENCRTR